MGQDWSYCRNKTIWSVCCPPGRIWLQLFVKQKFLCKFLPVQKGRVSFKTWNFFLQPVFILSSNHSCCYKKGFTFSKEAYSNSTTARESHWSISKTPYHLLSLPYLSSHLPYGPLKKSLNSSKHHHAQRSHPTSKSHP